MKPGKLITIVLILSSAFFLGYATFRSTLSTLPQKTDKQPQAENPLFDGFQFTEYTNGKKSYSLQAENFYLRNKLVKPFGFRIAFGKSAELGGVTVTFYRDDRPVSTLYSRGAVLDVRHKDIIFEGNPALLTGDKRTLSAKKIFWSNTARRLTAEDRCILGAEGKRYSAARINTDVELIDFTLINEKKS